jgi:hypothetical protein
MVAAGLPAAATLFTPRRIAAQINSKFNGV